MNVYENIIMGVTSKGIQCGVFEWVKRSKYIEMVYTRGE